MRLNIALGILAICMVGIVAIFHLHAVGSPHLGRVALANMAAFTAAYFIARPELGGHGS